MTHEPKIIICGNYGATNLGDEAILEGILALVSRVFPKAYVTVLSSQPSETSTIHKIESAYLLPAGFRSFWTRLFSGEISRTMKLIRECDAFILGGGGLFTDEKMMAILIWSLQAHFALLIRKPLFCFAQSVGPLRTFLGRWTVKGIFKKAHIVTVRDSGSAQLLQDLGVNGVRVLTDPAFALHVAEPLPEKTENFAVISVRPWLKNDEELSYKKIAQFADWLWTHNGLKSVLIPFQSLIDDDAKELNKIFEHIKNKDAAHVFEFTEDYQKVIELIARSRAVVGMRLHSLIFSTLVQKPFLALSYSSKVRQFVEDLELGDYVIDWTDLRGDDKQQDGLEVLKNRFELLLKNYDSIQARLSEKVMVMRNKVYEHEELLKKLIG